MAIAQARPQQVYMAQQGMGRGGPSGLADVLEVLLDKGLVIDAFVRVSLVGIELLTIDVRVVVASVDTYLRFAEAVNRLDLLQVNNSQNLGDLVSGGSSKSEEAKGSRALSSPIRSESASKDEPREAEPVSASRSNEQDDRQRSSEQEEHDGEEHDGEEHDGSGDDKGLLSKIKERGQVF